MPGKDMAKPMRLSAVALGLVGAAEVEGADDLAADALADDEDAARDDVAVGVAPGVDLELNAGVELLKSLAGADRDWAAVAGEQRWRHLAVVYTAILPCFWLGVRSQVWPASRGIRARRLASSSRGLRAGRLPCSEAAAEFGVGIAQGEFRIDLQVTGEVDACKQQIAQFFGDWL